MRASVLAIILAAASLPAAQAGVWTAACTGQKQIQYVQTVGGDGYLHIGQSDGTFTSIKLKQNYFDGKIICGSTTTKAAPNQVEAICADNANQTIRLVYGSQYRKGVRPENVPAYCHAVVNVVD